MNLLTLLTTLAENAHHQISIEELVKDQSISVREAFIMNKNAPLRNILDESIVNYPDRDRVVTLVK